MIKKVKEFISGLYTLTSAIIMWIPFHWIRIIFLKITLKKLGGHTSVCRNVDVRAPWRIEIGEYTTINKHVLLDGRGISLIIGNNVDIAQECNIWTAQHDYNNPHYNTIRKTTIIEDYAWIASRCTILPGVKIGYGAVIGAGSIVTKDVPPFTIVAGAPAKEIGKRKGKMNYHLGKRYWFQ